ILSQRNTTRVSKKSPSRGYYSTNFAILSTPEDSSSSFLNERNKECTRILQDLYEITEKLDNLTLFCIFVDCELVKFQETVQDDKWMNTVEVKAIEKNDT
ncbi:hypothetical protein PanWU01x14_279490, partial [Parasponia andersonii]